MKELKDYKVEGKSTFLTLTAKLPANTPLAMFAGNTGAMVPGHESEIISIDYEEVLGLNTPVVNSSDGRGQIIVVEGEDVQLAKDGEKPKAVTIRFASGRTMTLGLLLQGQDKTSILFKGDTVPTKATDLNLGNVADKLMGKRLKCVKFWRDATNTIVRNSNIGGVPKERSYAANCYEFIETDAV